MIKSVNQIAKAMKDYYGADEQKVRHFVSVYTLSKTIGELEKLPSITQEYLEIASLMHDIDNIEKAKDIMKTNEVDDEVLERVAFVIEHFNDLDHITGLDHQILLEAHYIVDFKEHRTPRLEIINCANTRFMTNYGKAFLKKAFNI